jgi:hypothetical protein
MSTPFQDALFRKVFLGRHMVVYPAVVQLEQLSGQSGHTLETGQRVLLGKMTNLSALW